MASSRIVQIVNRSSDVASVYMNFDPLLGSIKAPTLKARGFRMLKSSGFFRNITTTVRIPAITRGNEPHSTTANTCLKRNPADIIAVMPSSTAATIIAKIGAPTTDAP